MKLAAAAIAPAVAGIAVALSTVRLTSPSPQGVGDAVGGQQATPT
jgi:hypothetical protein